MWCISSAASGLESISECMYTSIVAIKMKESVETVVATNHIRKGSKQGERERGRGGAPTSHDSEGVRTGIGMWRMLLEILSSVVKRRIGMWWDPNSQRWKEENREERGRGRGRRRHCSARLYTNDEFPTSNPASTQPQP